MTTSRRILTAAVGAFALGLVPGTAQAQAPFVVPAPSKGAPSVVAAGEQGAAIVAWSTSAIYEGFGPLTVDTVLPGPDRTRRRWSTDRSLLQSSAGDGAGNLDLLTIKSPRGAGAKPRLVLYRARQGARVRQVWTGPWRPNAAVARRGNSVAIAWIEPVRVRGSRPDRQVLRLTTSTGGGRFTRPRAITGVLPRFIGRDDPAYVSDLDLTLDAGGNPVVALTAWHRPAPVLVLASLTRAGRVRARKVASGVDGLVDAHTTATGRVAVLVEDTGIEGDAGECVGDGNGRKIWATVREPGTSAFGAVQRLESTPFSCAGTGSELVSSDGGLIGVLWSNAPEGLAPAAPSVQLATAAPGSAFGAPAIIDGALLRAATFHGGSLFVLTSRPTDVHNPYAGPLVLQAVTGGSGIGPLEPVEPNGAAGVVADTSPSGTATLLAWRAVGRRDLQLRWIGGQ